MSRAESDPFERDYRRVATAASATQQAASQADQYATQVKEALARLQAEVVAASADRRDLHYAKGFTAEAWHSETYNVDAVRRGKVGDAWTPNETSQTTSAQDIVFGPAREDPVQSKYYKTAEDTAKAISHPDYHMDKVVPSDQLDEVRSIAARLADKNSISRPEQADEYRHTAATTSDHLERDGASSRALTEAESRELTSDARDDERLDMERWGLTPEKVVQLEDVAREALRAGGQAAAISAAMSLAPLVIAALKQAIKEGELDTAELARLAKAAPWTVLRSGVSGTLTAALVAAAETGKLGATMSEVSPSVIAYTVVLSINCLQTSYRAATGEISWTEASVIVAKDGLVLAGAMAGAHLGAFLIPVPLLGSMIGSIVGASIARILVQQGEGFLMGLAVRNGWTYFGIVTQNYTLPEQALRAAGFDVVDLDKVELDTIDLDTVTLDTVELDVPEVDGIPFQVLRRGLVSIGTVAYT